MSDEYAGGEWPMPPVTYTIPEQFAGGSVHEMLTQSRLGITSIPGSTGEEALAAGIAREGAYSIAGGEGASTPTREILTGGGMRSSAAMLADRTKQQRLAQASEQAHLQDNLPADIAGFVIGTDGSSRIVTKGQSTSAGSGEKYIPFSPAARWCAQKGIGTTKNDVAR